MSPSLTLEHAFNQSCKMGSQQEGLQRASVLPQPALTAPVDFCLVVPTSVIKIPWTSPLETKMKKKRMTTMACTTIFICL